MINIDDLKAALRIPLANVASDELIQQLESDAVARVQRHTGHYYGAAEATTEYVAGDDATSIWLKDEPITSDEIAVTVTERSDVADAGTAIVMDEDDGFVIRGRRLYRKNGLWSKGYEYEVTYTRGYAAGAEPGDVRRKVLGLVVLWYTTRIPTPERDAAERALLGAATPRV